MENLQGGVEYSVSDTGLIRQITSVLRMERGDECILLDNTGFEYAAEIGAIEKNSVKFRIVSKKKNENEPAFSLTLFQALPKKMELFEMVLQKGAEIGVSKFVPLITERTERQNLPKQDRLMKILKEAAEQSGRGIVPKLENPRNFQEILQNLHGASFLFDSKGKLFSEDSIKSLTEKPINIFVGPEGGFTDKEIAAAQENGIHIASLGPRTLRTETAGIVIPAIFLLKN